MKKTGLVVALFSSLSFAAVLSSFWLQGCQGNYPPVAVMVVTTVPTPAYPTCTSVSTPTLIDDMENNSNALPLNQCRSGFWYNYHDASIGGIQSTGGTGLPLAPLATATAQPTPTTEPFTLGNPGVGYGGTGTSLHAIEVSTNNGFTNYGAGFGFSFINGNIPYNAFGYHGVQFFGRNSLGPVVMSYALIDNAVYVTNSNIGPHAVNIHLNPTWQFFQVSFAQLAAAANGYGGTTVFDQSKLVQNQFSVGPGVASDIWIDNVSFY